MNGFCLHWNPQASSTAIIVRSVMRGGGTWGGRVHCTEIRRELSFPQHIFVRMDQHRERADALDTPKGSGSFFVLAQLIRFLQGLPDVLQEPHRRFIGSEVGLSRWAS